MGSFYPYFSNSSSGATDTVSPHLCKLSQYLSYIVYQMPIDINKKVIKKEIMILRNNDITK
jgi:hypothetical protein